MEALVFDGTLQYHEEYPKPVPGSGESLVRVLLAAICNTDREILKGYRPDFKGVLGHEFVGMVEESEEEGLLGKRVVAELNTGCGECVYCKTGREKHCISRRVLGIHHRNGIFAGYAAIPNASLHVVPEGLSNAQAVFTEPLAAALDIPRQYHLPPDEAVALVGDGRLAFMIAQVLALYGIELHIFGHHGEKLEAFAPFGLPSLTPEGSYETVIEATGSQGGLETALFLTRSQGRLIIKSTYAGKAQVDMSEVVVREIQILGSRCGPFPPALRLLEKGLISFPPLDLYPLREYEKAFASRAFKSGFYFP